EWRPEVDYSVSGNRGQLTVSQPEGTIEGIPDDSLRNEWQLRLNSAIPMSLNANLGVGQSRLDLSGLTLTGLTIRTGVGETTIDLTGDWQQGFDVNIEGGVGTTTVRLPRAAGVRVTTSTGIGNVTVNDLNRDGDAYTNDAYDEGADVVLDVAVEGGVGEITLELDD
ncbi:MAG TPA: toast rack family protein, partial [Anaerolineae bacterium]